MSDPFKTQLSNLWSGLRKKTVDALAGPEASFARGKIAARTILDEEGNVLVEAGHPIDDSVIERAQACGKIHALVSAAVTGQVQDARDHLRTLYEQTPDGIEAKSLASSEDYIEARRCIGHIAAVDVTDIRGNILVAAGQKITDEEVRAVREAGQLAALIHSVSQSPPPAPIVSEGPVRAESQAQTPGKRAARPLADYYKDSPEEEKPDRDASV